MIKTSDALMSNLEVISSNYQDHAITLLRGPSPAGLSPRRMNKGKEELMQRSAALLHTTFTKTWPGRLVE